MRTRPVLAILSVLALIATGCGPDDPEPPADQTAAADQERVDELEASLDDAEQRVRELEADNEALASDLAAARDADEPADGDADDAADDGEPSAISPAQQRTAEGLIDQLRARIITQDGEFPDGWEPGTTDWEPFEVPAEVDGSYDSPGAVMTALAAAIEAPGLGTEQWETTIRVLPDDDDPDLAYGAVLAWGYLDDAVAGRDVRITLTRTDDDQWQPGGAEQRFQCMRGVTDDGELCV